MARAPSPAFLPAILVAALTQCAGERQSPRASDDARMQPAARVEDARDGRGNPKLAPNQLDDRQIAMVLDAFHSAVLDQARIAYSKTKDDAVKRYAQTLVAEHQRAKKEETELFVELGLSPEENALATDIGVESGKALFAMRDAEGARLDRVFVAAQVALQDDVLRALDQMLIRSVGNPRIRQTLETLRPRVELHLEMARGLKQALEAR